MKKKRTRGEAMTAEGRERMMQTKIAGNLKLGHFKKRKRLTGDETAFIGRTIAYSAC